MNTATNKELTIRNTTSADGAKIWEFVQTYGKLDLNSAYCYMIISRHLSSTCYVAEQNEQLAGFITSYYLPDNPRKIFIWQVGVNPDLRGQGIATRLLQTIAEHHPSIREIQTTIEPTNKASIQLFKSFAERNSFKVSSEKFLNSEDFPIKAPHADEDLFTLTKDQ
ncbi:MAG: diaminobutyrate acetyltransferase [Lentisphaeraceae bacterium]|nr:diaminobutyrate acetyltransferase [Lentisphaeraceae bacterium]